MTIENMREEDIRVNILDTLLTCPHRDVTNLVNVHNSMDGQDPIFYARLGVWAQENIPIRDHKELFIAKMFLSEFPEHREAAFVLLQGLPPYQVNNVIDHIKGKSEVSRENKIFENRFGKNLPRIFRSAVTEYLRTREADRDWFDGAALKDRKALKSLYCRARIAPGNDHVRAVLFNTGSPDPGSRFEMFKNILSEKDSSVQAQMIVEAHIPYTTAIGLVSKVTPAIFIALINNMTSQELLVNLNSIKEKGAFDNPDVKALIDQKIKLAKKDKKVDALKASQAVKNISGLSKEVEASFEEITNERLKEIRITRSTALVIDKSASMSDAIEASKYIGALIAARCTSDFYCYAFDRNAISIDCTSPNLSDWENAMRGIKAAGGTSLGASLQAMIRQERKVDQFVIVSDFSEMNPPFFTESYQAYCDHFNCKPNIIMVKMSGRWGSRIDQFIQSIEPLRIESDTYTIDQGKVDYYSLPTLLRFMARKSKFDLVQEILEIKLPKRK